MTRYHGATKTRRYSYDRRVSGSASAVRLANAFNFQARKRRLRGVLSTLIPRAPGRRLTAMNAHATAQPKDLLSAATCRHSGPLVGVKRLIGSRDRGSGGSRLVRGWKATAGMPDRGDG
jgi:hypothetical protein